MSMDPKDFKWAFTCSMMIVLPMIFGVASLIIAFKLGVFK